MAVAGVESLAAVSMSRVAAELDASPMSLYRYVASKEDLLLLMVDAIYRTPPSPHAADGGWREGLRRWACEQHAILDRHTWALYVPVSGPPMTPHQLNWLEQGLARLGATALAESEKLSVIMLLSGFIRNEATVTAEVRQSFLAAAPDERTAMASYGRLMRGLTEPGRFPAMNRVIDAGVLDEPTGSDEEFAFGLDRVLDGVGVLVRTRAGEGGGAVPADR
ncbi:TetR/AcrR family transcriptional regulator [Streptomyces cinereospinus]